MKKNYLRVKELDKDKLSYICTECGAFYKSMKAMDKHLYHKHNSPVLVTVSNKVN